MQFVLHTELKSWTREVDGATESRQKQPVKFPLQEPFGFVCFSLFFFFLYSSGFLHFWKRLLKMPILDVTKDSGTMHKSLIPSPLKGC